MQTKTKAARLIRNTWMVIPLSLVGIYGFMSFYGFFSLMETHKWVDHTHVVISSATEIEKLIVDLEAAERGFLITGDEQFLEPYHIADQQLNKQIEALKTRVSDNPPQVKTLKSIETLLESWFEQVAKHEISVRKEIAASTIDADHLQSELKKEAGKKILDRIDKNLEALNAMFQKAEHSQAITTMQALENTVLSMVTAQRNFLLTGVESALSPYASGKKSIPDQIESLHQLIDRAPDKTLARQNIASLQSHLTATLPQQSENPNPTAGMLSSDELNKAHQALNRVLEQFSGSGHEKASLVALQIKNLLTADDINISHINLRLSTLTALIENTYAPNQARRHLNRINTLATEWITQSADLEITLRRRSDNHTIGTNAAVALLEIGVGKEIMDNMKALLQSFKSAEYKLMAHRKSKAKHDAIQSLTILAIGALLIFALALIVLRVSFRLKRNSKNLEAESVKLRENESISRNIVNTSLDSILTINTKGRILSCNAAVERVFGYATGELLGRNINILMPDQIANEHDRYLHTHMTTGTKKSIWQGRELTGKRKDGEEFPIFISIGSADSQQGRIFIGFIRDITKEKQAQEELQRVNEDLTAQNWLRSQVASITELTQGATDLQLMCDKVISRLSVLVEAGHGVLYVTDLSDHDTLTLSLMGSFAFQQRKNLVGKITLGEGLVGQCAKEKKVIHLTEVPADYIRINSALGEQVPLNIIAVPILFEQQLIGVIELASFREIDEQQSEMIQLVTENIGIVINNIRNMERTNALLNETKRQSDALKIQQEELKNTNESLEQQACLLKSSQEELQQQSEELIVSNEELEEKQSALKKQNQQVEEAKKQMEVKARELANASKYKSEFLANMSHELRTPLNSLLLLSKDLADNKDGNLTDSQVEDARIIYEGGNDLLCLINDIMDLSKVEAGKLNIHLDAVNIENIVSNIKKIFQPVAKDRNIAFNVTWDDSLDKRLTSDGQRIEQILKNLLSNAFKFTEQGSVDLKITHPSSQETFRSPTLAQGETIAFAVIDTGIGIPEDKQQAIFEAFQQQDGSTSRKYGGTGLGLTISRELARLLGGEIHLHSREQEGSTFCLYLPKENTSRSVEDAVPSISSDIDAGINNHHNASNNSDNNNINNNTYPSPQNTSKHADSGTPAMTASAAFISDDRKHITPQDKTILIIEDDKNFATALRDLSRTSGYKCLVANEGRNGLYLAMQYEPSGIILDMGLPDISGNQVLEQLKFSLRTRHIPVQIVSGHEDHKNTALAQGAIGYLTKPVSKDQLSTALADISSFAHAEIKQLLLVEDDEGNQRAVSKLLDNAGVSISCVNNGAEACTEILSLRYDCVILDLQLPDMSGFDVIKTVNQAHSDTLPPIIVYTGKDLTDAENIELDKYAATTVIKGAGSPERLLDDVSLFLHSIDSKLEHTEAHHVRLLHDEDAVLNDRKILLVDDDMRNAYALSKKLFEVGLQVELASNGQEAVDMLEENPDYELILMDIMMPVMDGYKATERIRQMPHYKNVPIIALTAKAMMEDRQKCLEAGASEYLTKPIDFDKLQSLLRIWLFKRSA